MGSDEYIFTLKSLLYSFFSTLGTKSMRHLFSEEGSGNKCLQRYMKSGTENILSLMSLACAKME